MGFCSLFVAFLFFLVYIYRERGEIQLDSQNTFDKDFTIPLRGLAALLVVTGHLENYLNSGGLGNITLLHILHWSTPAVSVFFFMSGYGLYKKQFRSPITSIKWIIPSVAKIFIALFVICSIYLAVYYWLDKSSCIYLIINGSGAGRIELLPHSWYMYVQMLFYIFFYVCYRYFKKNALWILCCLILLYSILVWYDKYLQLNFALWTKAIWAFPIGIFVSTYEDRIKQLVKKHFRLVFLSVPCFIILCIIASKIVHTQHLDYVLKQFILLNFLGVFVYIIFMYLKFPNGVGKILTNFGVISMEIYLVQGIFQKSLLYFVENKYIYVGFNYFFIVLFAMGIHWLFVKIGLFGTKNKYVFK
ncbi:MAG: acyltransferase [Bacteroidales bacterium]|nr:acyltransferase [Bacteroidales bacterium]